MTDPDISSVLPWRDPPTQVCAVPGSAGRMALASRPLKEGHERILSMVSLSPSVLST